MIISSALPAIGAAGLLALLGRLTAQPSRIFLIVAGVFLALSFAGPFTLPVPLSTQLALNLMHIVAGAAIAWALVTRTRA